MSNSLPLAIMEKKRVVCVVVAGFEELELVAPVDLLRRAEAHVILASLTGERAVTGRNGIVIETDAAFAEVADKPFDLLMIPGGPGVEALRDDERTAALAREAVEAGRIVGAICAAPLVLADAGLLDDRQYVAHFSVNETIGRAAPTAREVAGGRVVEDGAIITATGAGAAIDFGLALVRRLFGDAAAVEVAADIMA